jgi:hypothetical protein
MILPSTKEGKDYAETKFSEALAEIACKRLNLAELGELIKILKSEDNKNDEVR